MANIRPGEKVKVQIQYVETLKYEDGGFEFNFPMVVGPRYVPAGTDGSHIAPPVTARRHSRQDTTLSLSLSLDAGLPAIPLRSKTHDIDSDRQADSHYAIKLRNENEIPNKDFLLKYNVAGKGNRGPLFSPTTVRIGGFFTLILQPPQRSGGRGHRATGTGLCAGYVRIDVRLPH